MALFFSLTPNVMPSVRDGGLGWKGSAAAARMFHRAVMQSAKCNITKVVELCDLCVFSGLLWERKRSRTLFLLLLVSTQHATRRLCCTFHLFNGELGHSAKG